MNLTLTVHLAWWFKPVACAMILMARIGIDTGRYINFVVRHAVDVEVSPA